VGAEAAAREAVWHRDRFSMLEREIDRREAARPPHLADKLERNPFVPDAAFAGTSAGAANETPAAALPVLANQGPARRPRWDMYRPHDPARTAGTDSPGLTPAPVRASAQVATARWGMYDGSPATTLGSRVGVTSSSGAVGASGPRELGTPFFVAP
jgi:hypothetical protein